MSRAIQLYLQTFLIGDAIDLHFVKSKTGWINLSTIDQCRDKYSCTKEYATKDCAEISRSDSVYPNEIYVHIFDETPSSDGSICWAICQHLFQYDIQQHASLFKGCEAVCENENGRHSISPGTKVLLDHILHTESIANLARFNLMPGLLNMLPVTMFKEEKNEKQGILMPR